MGDADIQALARIAARREPDFFDRCLAEQRNQKRMVLVAEQDGKIVGCAHLVWSPAYAPFRRTDIPEIQDLAVVSAARRNGIGALLVDACEQSARQAGKTAIGIGVGLDSAYGAAQRLYVRKGYIPDGAGICHDDAPVRAGELRAVDDLLTLKMIKNL